MLDTIIFLNYIIFENNINFNKTQDVFYEKCLFKFSGYCR